LSFADVNGQRLYYEEHGEGEPLLLVMGLAADHLAWVLQLPEWSKHFRTICFDNRDVGQSSYAQGPYELSDMAADTLALADHLGLDTFHLVGVSMGGAISQELALAAPERVRTLTLCVTWASSGPWGREKTRLWGIDQQHRTRDQTVDELLLLTLSERFYENPEAVAYVRGMMMANPHPQAPDAFARQAAASGNHETRDRLDSLEMPVHVIGAEHDILVPVWKSKELADLIPGARYTIIEGAPHGLQVENAEVFNAAVLDFLRSEQGAAV